MSSELYRIVYISHSTIQDEFLDTQLADIQQGSSQRNAARQISGQLIYCEKLFIQTLEGDRDTVNLVIEKIKQDTRHNGFKVVFYGKVAQRDHGDWSQMQVITDTSRQEQFTKYIKSIAYLPLNTITAEQTKDIIRLLTSFNQTEQA